MKIKNILRSFKKIPLLCLLGITIFLSDGIYDGILPWPSPFHITLAYSDRSDHTLAMADAAFPAPGNDQSMDVSDNAESLTDGNASGGSASTDRTGNESLTENGGDTAGSGTDTGTNDSGLTDADGSDTAPESGGLQQTDSALETDGPADIEDGTTDAPDSANPAPGEDGLPPVQYIQVEDDYFDDAVFIGDSRTRSLELYANLEHTTFLADTGLTIYTVLDKKLTPSTMISKTTVADYLSTHQFSKIYVMLGINELGTGTAESFCRSYSEVLDTLRELQPDAIIYLQAILHISESKDKERTYINNAAIIERNEALQSLVDNEHIFWLDSNPAVCDEDGYLIDSYTFDGVHLQAKYVYLWTDYLKQHAVLREDSSLPQSPFPAPQPYAMP